MWSAIYRSVPGEDLGEDEKDDLASAHVRVSALPPLRRPLFLAFDIFCLIMLIASVVILRIASFSRISDQECVTRTSSWCEFLLRSNHNFHLHS